MATATTNLGNESESQLGAEEDVVFLMVPLPLQSHLNQLLRLAHLIHSKGFPVHYAAFSVHCRQVKLRHDDNLIPTSQPGVIFHEFPTPHFLSPHPSSSSPLNFLTHLQPSTDASLELRKPVAALLRELSSSARTRRLVIIHDNLMNYVVQDAASLPNAESYSFYCGSAFFRYCFVCQISGKPFPLEIDSEENIPTAENCFAPGIIKFAELQIQFHHIDHAQLFNTCLPIDTTYLDLLLADERKKEKKQWAIAPLFPVRSNYTHNSHPTLEWLDNQPRKSVIYISFGSTTSMSHEQIKELALGLEQSEQRFLWVLREADRGDIFIGETRVLPLPEGFEERVKGVGKVTRDWAPQLGILGHPSVGGFVSHCGWNSCLESLTMGVPLITWPMHSDQPYNAILVTDVLKVGVPVIGWRERDQLVTSSTIMTSIQVLMTSSEGHAVRKRAEGLGEAIKQSAEKDEHREFNSFIAYAAR